MRAGWRPYNKQGRLTKRSDLPDNVFAYPEQRKEPMTNAAHVRNALARFNQVEGVSDAQRASAFANIKKAAAHFGVEVSEKEWQDLGREPSSPIRKKSASGNSTTAKKRAKRAPQKRTKKGPTQRRSRSKKTAKT